MVPSPKRPTPKRKRINKTLTLDENFRCSVCHDISRNMLQCTSGHIHCLDCIQNMERVSEIMTCCSICRCTGMWSYPHILYNMIRNANLTFPCSNAGCTHRCDIDSIDNHQKSCTHMKINCPCDDTCSYYDKPNTLYEHLLYHKVNLYEKNIHKIEDDFLRWVISIRSNKCGLAPYNRDTYLLYDKYAIHLSITLQSPGLNLNLGKASTTLAVSARIINPCDKVLQLNITNHNPKTKETKRITENIQHEKNCVLLWSTITFPIYISSSEFTLDKTKITKQMSSFDDINLVPYKELDYFLQQLRQVICLTFSISSN